jgi:hypothetical protein
LRVFFGLACVARAGQPTEGRQLPKAARRAMQSIGNTRVLPPPHALAKPKIQQQCGTGALIVRRLAADGADTVGVFVTNGGYNGVQQVLRLSTPLSPKPHQIKLRKRLIQNGEN